MTRKGTFPLIWRSPKNLPLRWALVVPFVVQLVSAIGVFGYLSFRNERNTIESLAYELMGKATETVQSQLDSYLKTPHLLNQTSRNLIEQGALRSSKDFQAFFARQVHSPNSVDYMAWGDRNGHYIDATRQQDGQVTSSLVNASTNFQFLTYQSTPEGKQQKLLQNSGRYDPRTRPWYKAALQKRAATWSPIYVWFDGSKIAIDAVLPVYDSTGQELGVLDIPVALSRLSGFLHQLAAQQTGHYLIVEPSGALVATSTQEPLWIVEPGGSVKRRFAAESATPLIRAIWQQLRSPSGQLAPLPQQNYFSFEWQGQRQYVQVNRIKEQGISWVMIAVIPESSFMDQANANTRTTIGLCLVAFVIATGVTILTAQRITQPILRLNASAKQFVQSFSSDPTTTPTNEVEELATSFQRISEQLQTFLQAQQSLNAELEQRVVERTQDLAQTSDRLTLALQAGAIGTWDWDFVHEVNWDESTYTLYGLQSLNRPVTYQDWIQTLHPDDRAETEARLQAAIRGEQEFDTEFRMIRPDGAIRFIKASALTQYDPTGNPQHLVGINYDITERKQAEQTVRENEQFLRSIYDGVEQAIFVVDVQEGGEFYFVGINPAHERLSGLRSADLAGKTPEQALPAAAAIAVRQRYQTCLERGESITYEECLLLQEEPTWWITSLSPLRDRQGQVSRIVGTSININNRKALEQELAHQRQLLEQELAHNRQLLDAFVTSAPVGMCVLDSQLRYTLVNEALATNNRLAVADHLGKTIWEVVPDFAAAQADQFRHALLTGETTLGAEVVSEMPNCPGIKRTWLVSLFPLQAQSKATPIPPAADTNAADSLGIIITEITERKRVEEQIKASLREKEVLLQEIHHRVKNNLQIIDGLLQMQYRRTTDLNAAAILLESQHRVKSIALVHEKLYRSEDLGHIDFSDYVRSLVSNLIESYQASSSRITVLIQIRDISLDIDQAIPCGLIMNELVSNALKYAFPNNQPGKIQISLAVSSEGWLALTVADDGVGIPAHIDLQKTKSLGLKLVRGLAAQLEGTVEIYRQSGTLIQVLFPARHTGEGA